MKYIKALLGVMILTAVDQITKYLAVTYLKDGGPIPVIQNVFELQYLENRGSAFGLMQNRQVFLIISTLLIAGVFVWLFCRLPVRGRMFPLSTICVLIIAGAVGNLVDRLMHGYVVDFLYFKLIDFPIFNVADIYVTVSAFALIILGIFYYKEEDFDAIFHRKKAD